MGDSTMTTKRIAPSRTLAVCQKCGYQWFKRKETNVQVCPFCRHPDGTRVYGLRKYRVSQRQKGPNFEKVLAMRKVTPCISMQEIGEKLGITRERVRQILKSAGQPTKHYVARHMCAGCGRKLQSNNKSGYCQKCSKERNRIPLVCDECSTLFYRTKAEVLNRAKQNGYEGKVFCSKHCQGVNLARIARFSIHLEHASRTKGKSKYDISRILATVTECRLQGMAYKSIAAQVGMPEGTLSNLVHNHRDMIPRVTQVRRGHRLPQQRIRIRWLLHLNFDYGDIKRILHCSDSTIYKAIKD